MWIGDRPVFRGTGAWTIQPAALFQRLRRTSARPAPAPAAEVYGRTQPTPARLPHAYGTNVVISSPRRDHGGEFVSSLIVDHTHPYFFDHPCDHVPGMLLLEGCAQFALAAWAETGSAAQGAGVCAYDMTFAQFVQCGIATTLTAHLVTPGSSEGGEYPPAVCISIAQDGSVLGTATICVATGAAA
jgi:3-hydroxymyristoyl/3-hydroxydecanoyl-(acyl carrier protein) dehydratase